MEEGSLDLIYAKLEELINKASLPNSIAQVKNSRFYVPNYPKDCIQKYIVERGDYWDPRALNLISDYIGDDAVYVDAGANIGNHTLYWAIERYAKKIYSFEPVESTFEILKKNIELNHLEDVVEIFQVGLSDEETTGEISIYKADNIGGTNIAKSEKGKIKLITLDSLKIKEKIDLIKIDVEGAEVEVLKGSIKTIKKYKPLIVVESFYNFKEVCEILEGLGYGLDKVIRTGADYIFKYLG